MGVDTFWDLVWGYGAIWGLIVAYMIILLRDQRALAKKVSELEARLGSEQK
jgi:CcmD family protein